MLYLVKLHVYRAESVIKHVYWKVLSRNCYYFFMQWEIDGCDDREMKGLRFSWKQSFK